VVEVDPLELKDDPDRRAVTGSIKFFTWTLNYLFYYVWTNKFLSAGFGFSFVFN
jgi:hypothetical protein